MEGEKEREREKGQGRKRRRKGRTELEHTSVISHSLSRARLFATP